MKLEERSQRRGLRRWTNKIGRKMDAYNIVDDIKSLKRRISDVTRMRKTYAIGKFNEPQREETTSIVRVRELRRARSVIQEELVVGLEDDAKILLEKILVDDGDKKREMISIFGMGGLGKTALARKLYNSGDVKKKFEYRAWTYVSQEFKAGDILMRIIRSLGVASEEEMDKIRKYSVEDLEGYLYRLLEGKKYLVVVDDIWDKETWKSLKRALPCNSQGSRVIITTRIRSVAEGVDETVYYAHKLRFLTFEESWKLFEQKAFRNMQWVDEDLRKIGKEMIKKCGGLPLAIVVLAGLLSRKRQSEWNEVRTSLWRRLKEDSIQVSTVFDLTFKAMQYEMKLFFLYLSIFPEDYEIDVEKLIHLLVAEGFIKEDEELMEDVARRHIEELIDRSLVIAGRIERGKVMSCRIHDLLRDIAIKKAKELNFVNVYNEQHSSTCRRQVVHHMMDNNYLCDRSVNKRIRSLLFFGERTGRVTAFGESTILKMKQLRVLNLGGVRLYGKESIDMSLPDVIGDLIHLRYLGITDTRLICLPSFISNLRFLQTLDASGNLLGKTTDLSKLTSLRHLMGIFFGELKIGDAVNLQTLRSISSYSWSKLKHVLLKNLRDLEISDKFLLNFVGVPLELASFSKLTNLRVLRLEVEAFKLSSESDVIFPSLESLTLVETTIEEDPMPVLQKFPSLEDLVLKDCSYTGEKMSISAQGFGRLRKLKLKMVKLDVLHIEEESMPCLTKLNLTTQGQQTKLMIPDRLRALRGLN